MAHKPKTPMSIENRAKQFMPFSALKGLPEALAIKEQLRLEAERAPAGHTKKQAPLEPALDREWL